MRLETEFVLQLPLEEAWKAVTDPRSLAACFSAVDLRDYGPNSFYGSVSGNVGPIPVDYRGKARYKSRNEAQSTATLELEATSNEGALRAVAQIWLATIHESKTVVTLIVDIELTGRPAEFSRGMLVDLKDILRSGLTERLSRAPSAQAKIPVIRLDDSGEIHVAQLSGLGPQLGSGGQATVYDAPELAIAGAPERLVYKRYKEGQSPDLERMRQLIAIRTELDKELRSQLDAVASWPICTVTSENRVLGILIPRIPESFFQDIVLPSGHSKRHPREVQHLFVAPERCQRIGMPVPDLRQRLMICRDLARALSLFHSDCLNVTFGDLSGRNVLFRLGGTPSVLFLDCDDVRPRGSVSSGILHSPDWDPPDDTERLSFATDCYKAGLFFLRCLTPGPQASVRRDPIAAAAVLDAEGVELLTRSLNSRAADRPSANEWLNYFNSVLAESSGSFSNRLLLQDGLTSSVTAVPGESVPTPRVQHFLGGSPVGRDLIEAARQGRLDPTIARTAEIQQLQEILLRRDRNCALLVGPKGSGRAAIARGLAQAIASGHAPALPDETVFLELDLHASTGPTESDDAGSLYSSRSTEYSPLTYQVMFVDGILCREWSSGRGHDIVASILPHVASGEIRLVGTATASDLDAAVRERQLFVQLFRVVEVRPLGSDATFEVLNGMRRRLEVHHGVKIADDALAYAAQIKRDADGLSAPGCAIAVLDSACANARVRAAERQLVLSRSRSHVLTDLREAQECKMDAINREDFIAAAAARSREQSLKTELSGVDAELGKSNPLVSRELISSVLKAAQGVAGVMAGTTAPVPGAGNMPYEHDPSVWAMS